MGRDAGAWANGGPWDGAGQPEAHARRVPCRTAWRGKARTGTRSAVRRANAPPAEYALSLWPEAHANPLDRRECRLPTDGDPE